MPQTLPIRGNSWDPLIKLHIQALKITVPDNILIMPGEVMTVRPHVMTPPPLYY